MDDTKPLSEQRHPFFGPNEDDWNLDAELGSDDYGKPGVGIMANAISVWASMNGSPTMGEAAATFKMPVEAVAQCVEWHPWMYFVGDEDTPIEKLVIEHEGKYALCIAEESRHKEGRQAGVSDFHGATPEMEVRRG